MIKTFALFISAISAKKSENPHPVRMGNHFLQNQDSFGLVGICIEEDLKWHKHIISIASSAAKKLGFLFRARKYFSSVNLYTLYVSQIRPSLEYCSHIWGESPTSTLSILDSIQKRAIWLINNAALSAKITTQTCSWKLVSLLQIFSPILFE